MKHFSLKFFLMLLVCLCYTNVFAQWQSIGSNGLLANSATDQSIAIDVNGTPYVAYRDEANGFKATVKKFNGFSWETVGAGFSASYASSLSLALDKETPYVAFIDQGTQSKAIVKKFNGNSWVEVGTTNFAANYATGIALSIDNKGVAYVAFADKEKENKATVKKFTGSTWVNAGPAGFTAGAANSLSFTISTQGVPFVAYADEAIGGQATVKRFDGTKWENIGNAGFTEYYVTGLSLGVDNNNVPYVVYRDEANNYKASVKKYDGMNWVNVGPTGFSAGVMYNATLAVGGTGTPYVSYVDYGNGAIGNSGTVQIKRFDGSHWDNVGPANLIASNNFDLALTLDANSFPYIAYADQKNNYKATVVNLASSVPFFNAISDNSGFKEDKITSDQTLILSGNAVMNATVLVFKDGMQIGQTIADADGKWNFDYTNTALTEGNHVFTATALVNNVASNQSKKYVVTIDATAPVIPAFASVNNKKIDVTTLYLNNKATFTGTAEAKSMVTLFANATKIDSAMADSTGAWVANVNLADNNYAITAIATDIAGNTSPLSLPVNIVVDTKAPAVPTVALVKIADLKAQTLSGFTTSTTATNNVNTTTPTLTGTAEANATINIYVDGKIAASTATDSIGSWTYTFVSPLEAGKRVITVDASDKANNNSGQGVSLNLLIDTEAPVVTGIAEGGIYNTDKRIYFNEGTATLNNKAFNSNTIVSTEAVYNLTVTDAAGNVTIVNFEIDKTKPVGTVVVNNNADYTTTSAVTLSLTETGNATQMHFLGNNGVWTSWEEIASTKSWTLPTTDGSKVVSVQLRDAAGNISSTFYDYIKLDQKAPTTTISTSVKSPTSATALSFAVRFSEVVKGFAASNVTVTNGTLSKFTGSNNAYSFIITPATSGTITVKVDAGVAFDVAGNKNLVSNLLSINFVGLSAPTVTTSEISALGASFVTLGGNVTATGNVTVTDRGIVYSKTGTPTISNTKVNMGTGAGAFSKSVTGLTSGTYYVRAYAINTKGTSYGSVVTFTIMDKAAPVVTGVSEGGLYNISKKITFNEGTATLNNVAFTNGATVSAEGTYTLVVKDVLGNSTTIRFAIDKTKPTGTIFINNNAATTNTVNVTLNLTATDNPTQMRFLNNGVWGTWETIAATKAWTLSAGDGSKTASVQFRDAAGNISTSAYDGIILKQETTTTEPTTTTTEPTTTTTEPTTTLDKTAPVVTGVSNGGIYNTEKRIYFNEGTATLNNLPFSSNTLISAAAVYTLVVTDAAGNVTTVRFEIDKTKPTATLLINNNAAETNTVNVTLNMTHNGGAVQMRFINNGVWGAWEVAATTKAWTLSAGDGSKTASVQFRDAAGNISSSAYDGIILKQLTVSAARQVQEVKAEVETKEVAVYPNPAVDQLHVEVSEAGNGETTIQMIDLTGKVALTQKVTTTNALNTVLNVNQLQPGVYVLNINTPQGRISRRVIVK